MLRSWVAVLATVTLSAAAVAQPASLTAPGARSLASVDVLQLSPLNNDALLAEADAQALARTAPGPLKFAAPRMVTVAPEARGTWETLTDGRRVWRLVVSSPGAYSLNFGFSRYRLPEGAKLWIYPAGEVPEYRPFTHEDNEAHGELWTPIVPGDEAVIEVEFPQMKQGETPDFDLALGQVGHAFRPVLLSPREKSAMGVSKQSGSCNVDVVCPEGDGFRDIIRSSGGYTRSGVDICSGAAVNNTAQDGRPLFLTANHCGNSSGNAPSVVVYWNYQNSTCRTPGSAASGGPGDGPRSQFNSGTSLLGSAGASDWAILEFDDPIVPEAVVYLSGWDRRDAAPTSAIAIHHPGVEEKRISFENDPTSITTYLDDDPVANGTHIRVEDWDVGTTEGGSSGSPLYNTDKRIVGQLHGGFASCTSQTPDWYGRLYRSMNDGLAAVLDPTNSGMEVLDGKEATSAIFGGMAADVASGAVGDAVTFTVSISNLSGDTATGVQFTNMMPSDLVNPAVVSFSTGAASESGDAVSWTFDLADGEDATLTYTAEIADGVELGTTITNVGVLEHPSLDPSIQLTSTVRVVVQPTYAYTNAQSVSLPDNGCPSFATATLDVVDAFAIEDMRLGVAIRHTYRGDLRVSLTSPAGTMAHLVDRVGTGTYGSSADNLDVYVSDTGQPNVFGSDGDHNPAAPHYEVDGQPEQGAPGNAALSSLDTFTDEQAQGTWTLSVCDGAAQDTGSLVQWSLQFFNSTPPVATDDTPDATTDWLGEPEPNPAVGGTTLRFGIASAGRYVVSLYDVRGRRIHTVLDGVTAGGEILSADLNTTGLEPGVYFVRLRAPGADLTRSVTVVR